MAGPCINEPIEPMTLDNMRANEARSLTITPRDASASDDRT